MDAPPPAEGAQAAPVAPPAPVGPRARIHAWREKHQREESLAFFAGGFLFDAALLKRIDEPAMLIQQGSYLVVIGLLLSLVSYYEDQKLEPPRVLKRAWRLLDHLIHFLMGTLLNGYSIFYFHSASGLTAVGFLVIVAVLLTINEMPFFHRLGSAVLFGLYSICLTSYFAYLIPVIGGHLSRWMFYAAAALALVPLGLQVAAHWRWTKDRGLIVRQILAPALLVQACFVFAYATRIAPPVPLAVKEMGIYHDVKREADGYREYRSRPTWKFWEKGDQDFRRRPGDRVWVFARVSAPRGFRDRVDAVWFHHDASGGWRQVFKKPLSIDGKNERGFATDANLSNPSDGDWRVELQTDDGYTVGQLHFHVSDDDARDPRTFEEDFSPSIASPARTGA